MMKHHTDLENFEFELSRNETNLRYMLGDKNPNAEKISTAKKRIEQVKAEIRLAKDSLTSYKNSLI